MGIFQVIEVTSIDILGIVPPRLRARDHFSGDKPGGPGKPRSDGERRQGPHIGPGAGPPHVRNLVHAPRGGAALCRPEIQRAGCPGQPVQVHRRPRRPDYRARSPGQGVRGATVHVLCRKCESTRRGSAGTCEEISVHSGV